MKSESYNLATPFIINTTDESVDQYISTLSKYGKRYLRRAVRDYSDNYTFVKTKFSPVKYGESRPARTQQHINNIDQSSVECMMKYLHHRDMYQMYSVQNQGDTCGYIFFKKYKNFAVASCPVPTDKYADQTYFNYFIWYNMIKTCIEDPDVEWLNLGESKSWISEFSDKRQPTWRHMLRNRQRNLSEWDNINNSSFFIFIPKEIKDNPQLVEDYIVVQCNECESHNNEILHNMNTGVTCVCAECGYSHEIDNSHVVR